jgi:hypothetical protein
MPHHSGSYDFIVIKIWENRPGMISVLHDYFLRHNYFYIAKESWFEYETSNYTAEKNFSSAVQKYPFLFGTRRHGTMFTGAHCCASVCIRRITWGFAFTVYFTYYSSQQGRNVTMFWAWAWLSIFSNWMVKPLPRINFVVNSKIPI